MGSELRSLAGVWCSASCASIGGHLFKLRVAPRTRRIVPPNTVLRRTAAPGSELTGRGRAPMLVGGWRGRSDPCGGCR